MFDRLDELETELEKLESQLPEIYASGDQRAARDAGRRHAELKPVVDAYKEWRAASQDLADAKELLEGVGDDGDMREFLTGEIGDKEAQLADLEATIRDLLLPRDPNEGRNVIVEIQGTEGGEEANLWAGDLYRMYQRLAERHGFDLQPVTLGETLVHAIQVARP